MKRLPSSVACPLIRISYLLPFLFGILLFIHACIPHIFFLQDGDPKETQNLFELMSSTWTTCSYMLDGKLEVVADAMYFPYVMKTAVVLSWISIFAYALMAIPSAICSMVAFSFPPTARQANRAKRWMQFFCPNRVLFVFLHLLPLIPASFALILETCFRQMMAMKVTVHFIGIGDLLFTGILLAISILLWLLLLPAQNQERMDLYRLYKAKKAQ